MVVILLIQPRVLFVTGLHINLFSSQAVQNTRVREALAFGAQ